MSPTLNPEPSKNKDIVLINKWAAKPELSSFKIGDVVIMISPIDPNRIITKRILALGGDIVSRSFASPSSIADNVEKEEEIEQREKIRVPPFHVWVEGDATAMEHQSHSSLDIPSNKKSRDSREFASVSVEKVH